ncbi:MAG: hypothetical protein J0L60_02435 [Ignavibacteria bacterium]|nr:hypothetical protein [Ignavibacteria bacterium]
MRPIQQFHIGNINQVSSYEYSVDRSNIIDSILGTFNSQTRIVALGGEDGCGKTVFAKQFNKKQVNNSVLISVNGINLLTTDLNYLTWDLISQICVICQKQMPEDDGRTEGILAKYIGYLKHHLKSRNIKDFFVVVDGFDQIQPEVAERINHIIYFFFNLTVDTVNYLLIGDAERNKKLFEKLGWQNSTRTILSNFSYDETKKFLEEQIDYEESLFANIYRISKGNPTTISTLLRVMKRNYEIDFHSNLQNGIELDKLYAIEYELYKERFEEIDEILSVLVFGDVSMRLEQLLGVTKISNGKFNEILDFAAILEVKDGIVAFKSDSFARFVRKYLKHLENKALKSIVSYINQNPNDSTLNGSLIKYNHRIGNSTEVVRLLSPSYCEQMLADSRSYNALIENIELGLENVSKEETPKDSLRLALLKSILTDRTRLSLLTLEMLSCLALDDLNSALVIALKVSTIEDRFKLLTLLASRLASENKIIPEEIKIQINELFSRINFRPDNNLIDLIRLTMDFSIEITLKLINILRENLNDDDVVDSIISKITVDKISAGSLGSLRNDAPLLENIKNQDIRNFLADLGTIQSFDDDDFLRLFNSSEDRFAKITIMRLWIRSTKERKNLAKIIQKSIEFAIDSTELVLNASILNDLTLPIDLLTEKADFEELNLQITRLLEAPNTRRPTIDYIRLRVRFIYTSSLFENKLVINDYQEILDVTSEIYDLPTRLHGYLIILRSLDKYSQLHKTADVKNLKDRIIGSFFDQLEIGLRESAVHENIYNSFLEEIITLEEKYILMFFERTIPFLTEQRANDLYLSVLKLYLSRDASELVFGIIRYLFEKIKKQSDKETAAFLILRGMSQEEEIDSTLRNSCIRLAESVVQRSQNTEFLLNSYAYLLILNKDADWLVKNDYQQALINIISQIPCVHSQIVVNYKVSNLLVQSNTETSKKLLTNVEDLKRNIENHSFVALSVIDKLLSLLVRCLPGLDKNPLVFDDVLSFLKNNISKVPSEYSQLAIYVLIAERLYLNDKIVELNQIVQDHIFRILDNNASNPAFKDLFRQAARVIYLTSPVRFESDLTKIKDKEVKKQIVNSVIGFMMNRCPGDDKCEIKKMDRKLKYNTILQILSLIKYHSEDYAITGILTPLLDSIAKNKLDYTKEQLIDIHTKIDTIIASKLPDTRNIKHEGYVILLRSVLSRIYPKKNKLILEDLRNLNSLANNIPSKSDLAFVKCTILESVGDVEKDDSFIRELVRDINDLIEQIPVFEERMERLEVFLNVLSNIDRAKSKSYLKNIFDSLKNSEEAYLEIQKEFIDLAYKIDKNWAEKLVTIYDDDPARAKLGKSLKKHLNHIRVVADFENSKEQKLQYLPELSEFLLRKLNSGVFTPKSFKYLRDYIILASNLPFDEASIVYTFVIQNLVVKYKNTNEANTLLVEVAKSLMSNLNLVNLMEREYQADIQQKEIGSLTQSGTTMINLGERQKALDTIVGWFTSNEPQEIILIDPYFEPKSIDFLKLVKAHLPNSSVKVLTSVNKKDENFEDLRDTYQNLWQEICDEEAPDNEITFVNKFDYTGTPLHDRWLVSPDTMSGMSLGTSYSSLGINKITSISILDIGAVQTIINDFVTPFLEKRIKRLSDNSRLIYRTTSVF